MAGKGKVKKGFATYLAILFLAIVATFLVIVTIMLFSPFKNILGFKYFIYNDSTFCYNATGDAETEIFNFETISNINIDCNFATVKIERYYKVDNCAIKIDNNSNGFAKEEQNINFNYEIYYSDPSTKTNLNIIVHEPEGFLYFNKDISISLLIPARNAFNNALSSTTINITNTSGNVYIGTTAKVQNLIDEEDGNYITLNALNLKSNNGSIFFFPYTKSTMNKLFIKTNDSKIESRIDLEILQSLEIYSQNGRLDFKSITFSGTSGILNLNNSKFAGINFVGDIDIFIDNGYFDLEKLDGDISSNNATKQMSNATIYIKDVNGIVSLPFVNNSKIIFDKVEEGSQVYIHSTSGDINIDNCYGNAWLETKSGNVNVHTFANDIEVITESGNINVIYENTSINDELLFSTTSGKINLKVNSALAFILEILNNNGELRDKNIYIDWLGNEIVNPLTVNEGNKKIKVISNEKVELSLINND